MTVLLTAILALAACSPEGLSPLKLPDDQQSNPDPTPLPSPVPERILSICLGEEPRSLFVYGDQSLSARIIRQAIYDGPVDQIGSGFVPVILEEIPSQENGLVEIVQKEVFPGERIVDARGNITLLGSGVVFRPTGCADQECWEIFEGQTSVTLDQVAISYNLKSGILWSDGTPVTAEDSRFSYQTASLIYGDFGPSQLRYTESYELGEEQDLIWKGLPGFLGLFTYADYFFSPLPSSRWDNFTREEFLTAPQTNLQPLGWGGYRLHTWVPGDHITLLPNPYFPKAPGFDALVFRFVDGGEEALAAYSAGECQVMANIPELSSIQSDLLSLQRAGELLVIAAEGRAWEQISFGIDSLSGIGDLLQSPELRQALAGCIDREGIARSRVDVGAVVDDYTLPGTILSASEDEEGILYQPAESSLKLKELGWVDLDGDPTTGRIAQGVEGVPDGTQLAFQLLAAEGDERTLTLDFIKEGFQSCGVGLEVLTLPAAELLAAGPEGPVFGRDFDLAYFSWKTGNYQPCKLFLSEEVPGVYPSFPKGWGGVNATGYSQEEFDKACLILLTTMPDSDLHQEAVATTREIFLQDLPAIPLFFRRDLIVVHPEIQGLETGYAPLFWNIEELK